MQSRDAAHNYHTKKQSSVLAIDDGAAASVCPPVRESDENRSLGSIAKFASHAQTTVKNARDEATIKRFKLQAIARKLLPYRRVSNCLRSLVPGAAAVEIHHVPERDSAHFHNLRTCDSVWDCPVCAAKITEQRRIELMLAVSRAVTDGYTPILVTFTMRHNRGDNLASLLEALKKAYRGFKSGRAYQALKSDYGIAGTVTSTEVTHGHGREKNNGWHPHLHALMFLEPIAANKLRSLENEFKTRWEHVINAQGYDASWEHGLTVKEGDSAIAEYVAKFGHEPKSARWTVERELTKAPVKQASDDGMTPFQMLEAYGNGDEQAGNLFREYSTVFSGRAQLVWSRGLRDLLGLNEEISDEQVNAVEPDETVLLTTVTVRDWYLLLNLQTDVRGELLTIASKGNADLLNEHIAHLLGKDKPTWADSQNSPTIRMLESSGYRKV